MTQPRTTIVPPKPVVIERRVMRRRKTRRAAYLCLGASSLFAPLGAFPDPPSIPFIMLGAVALASGVATIVFRFTERPTEVVVRTKSGGRGPIIH